MNMEKPPIFSFFEVEEEDDDQTLITTSLQEIKNNTKDVNYSFSIGEDHLTKDYRQNISSAKAEMGQVREENQKLKHKVSKALKDYKSLQMHFNDFFQQEAATKTCSQKMAPDQSGNYGNELVSLSLGTSDSSCYNKHNSNAPKKTIINFFSKLSKKDNEADQELKLGLGCDQFDLTPPARVIEINNVKKDERAQSLEQLPPVHCLKTERSDDNEVLDQIPLKKARVSVKVVCDTQTMNDGCQWRKYGQKIAKGNPCPRAYYRCTLSPSCPVRKHVQRCAQDRSVLITTYEGTHDHPLSLSATPMASTTSAAASMLKSTSSTSQPCLTTSAAATTTFSSHHTNIGYNSRALQYPFYLPKTTISTYQSHPTITLDLTSNPHFNTSSSYTSNFTSRFSSSSTCLDFSSPSSTISSSIESNYMNNIIPFSYHPKQTPSQDNFKNNSNSASQQHDSSDTIAASTKALTSNPSFRSALAASITSLVRNVGGAKT